MGFQNKWLIFWYFSHGFITLYETPWKYFCFVFWSDISEKHHGYNCYSFQYARINVINYFLFLELLKWKKINLMIWYSLLIPIGWVIEALYNLCTAKPTSSFSFFFFFFFSDGQDYVLLKTTSSVKTAQCF